MKKQRRVADKLAFETHKVRELTQLQQDLLRGVVGGFGRVGKCINEMSHN